MTDHQNQVQATQSGGCLCGAIRYEFPHAAVISAHHCHCKDCQRSTGSGKATILFIPADALTVKGEPKTYTVVGSEGSHVTRGFCGNCGSPVLSYVAEQPSLKFIKAGSLDDSRWVDISSSYWRGSAEAWSPVDELLPSFSGNPE
jgi:hypothetical protein